MLLAAGSPGSFAPSVDYSTGRLPYAVAAGDLNGDGRPDLAVTNVADHTISVFWASGSQGVFAPAVDYPTGNNPQSVVISDLNGDGRLDLVTVLMGNAVSVLLASGSPGSFAAPATYATGSFPTSVAVGDLNGDGRPDLAVANEDSNNVSVLLASGTPGSFAAKADYPTGIAGHVVAIGDLNGDGRLDLAVVNHDSNTLSVLLASGSAGSFAAKVDFSTGSGPAFVAIANLNGDGMPDLAIAEHAGSTVSVLLNSSTPNPGGRFASKVDYSTGSHPSSVAVGDLNGDGRPDLAVGNRYSNSVSVLLAAGSPGSFGSKVDYPSGGAIFFLLAADLDNDGRLDLIGVNNTNKAVSVFLGNGSPGSFAPKVDYSTGRDPFGVAVGDLNGDGRPDLVVTNQLDNTLSVLLASGAPGSFAPKVDYGTGNTPRAVAIGDLNGDGRLDLAVANIYSSSAGILLASGAPGSFAPMVEYGVGTGSWSLAINDLNGDGRLDLAVVNASRSTVSVLLASGAPGSFASNVDYPTSGGSFMVTTSDLNSDGRPDLVFASTWNNSVSVLMASGSPGMFAPVIDFPVGVQPVSVAVGDLNGDGRPDLAVANDGGDTVSVLLNQPATTKFVVSAPSGVTTGSSFSVTVTLQDACGNTASGFSGPVTLGIKPGTGATGAALGGTTTVSAVSGVASFSGLSLDKRAADYVLVASATGSLAGESAAFAVGNAAPVAHDDSFTTYEDTRLPPSADALANDTDADGDALTGTIVSGPADGTFGATYTPAANYNGADSLTYRAYDGASYSNVATINITVLPVNDAPSFTKGANQSVAEDAGAQSVSGWATGIRPGPATALDEAGQSLSFVVTNDNNPLFTVQPAMEADGTLTYTPAANASGSATVTVQVQDNGGTANGGIDTSTAQTFTIAITPVNDAPVTSAASLSANEDIVTGGTLTASDVDGDGLTYSIVANGAKGVATITNAATGAYTYTPNANANGSDSFTFKVNDGMVDSNVATISITITSVNDVPVASAASLTTNEDTAANGTLSASDVDGDALTYSIVANGSQGVATITNAATGTFSYTPNANANGSDSFTFKVNDGTVDSNVATISITITSVNDATMLNAIVDTSVLESAPPQTVNLTGVSAGSADENGQRLAVTAVSSNPALIANPTVTYSSPNATGTLSYTPAAELSGSATITVTVRDDGGTLNGGIDFLERAFTISVTPVNDAPSFAAGPNQIVTALGGPQIVASWAGSFTPGPADEASQTVLGYTVVSNSHPALFAVAPAVAADGALTYTPKPGAGGTATIGVTVRDSGGIANGGVDMSVVKTFTITIGSGYRLYMPVIAR